MLQTRIAKIAGIAVGATVALGSFVPMAGAVTIAELQAQINALMAQLAALQGTTVTTSTTFTQNLTVGSTGAEVTALQQVLVNGGHLVMPAGVAMGYFGSLTKAAVAAWQAANGVTPAAGYWGPLSRAKHASLSTGATGTVPGAAVSTTVTTSGVITTPGAEGTITVSKNPNPASGTKLYENDSKREVFGIKLEAKGSDMRVERIKIDMDHVTGTSVADQNFYNKIATKIYVLDPDKNVLTSSDLNSTTVVKDGSDYFITLAGFGYVVPKNATRILTIAVDGRSTWDTDYDTETWSLGVPVDGVRAYSGASINQFGPSTAFTNSFTTEGDLSESATLTASTAADNPEDNDYICTSSSTEDECDKLTLLKFNVKAEKDDVLLTDVVVNISKMTGSGTASTSAAYLYDGSTLVGSATTMNFSGQSTATFTDIDYKIPKDTSVSLTFKVDVIDATIALTTFTASTTAANLTAENMKGTGITESGNGLGETIGVRKAGAQLTLKSKAITYGGAPGFSGATTTAKADFVITVKAVGSAVVFGDSASTTRPLVVLGTPLGDTASSSVIYRGGAEVSGTTLANSMTIVASSTAITVPSGVTATTTNSWVLAEGLSIDIPVSMVFNSRTCESVGGCSDVTSGAYAIQINRVSWATADDMGEIQVSNFMSGNSSWRTGNVTLP
ncbi:MAG: peptidoglycan-binding protein [Candidatus Zambryskibacteria bacterium]|nr:peptidoglycan-binding protein [Candidatus Zambryskibacteria bacterium]